MAIKKRISGAGTRIAEPMALENLLLDVDNPRFGGRAGLSEQRDILDHIVSTYGIDDVISSLAVNGYFKAEPLVGRRRGDKVTIIEGNRRLAACLVLTGDSRAANQSGKAGTYRALWERHQRPVVDPVPVITFDESQDDAALLSYLGVRHISASSPWDSYAKAHWAAQVVRSTNLTVTDISTMIGDPHRTVGRLLEGYYVISQVTSTGHFNPQDCVRKGRGSVTEYPFSWVYTILGYTATRRFLELPDSGPVPDPIPDERHLRRAGFMLRVMFGSVEKGQNSAIKDSRELGDLASAFLDKEKVALLNSGLALSQVIRQTRPVTERVLENLMEVRRLQAEIVSTFASEALSNEDATEHFPLAQANRRAAVAVENAFKTVIFADDDDD